MELPKFLSFLSRREPLVGVDIGWSAIKVIEIDSSEDRPTLKNFVSSPTTGDIFSSTGVVNVDKVTNTLIKIFEGIVFEQPDKRVSICVPATAVFTKRIKVPEMKYSGLRSHIEFEAANFIPSSMSNVKLDFHIVGPIGKNQLDIFVVAVKNEVLDSLLDAVEGAGLSVGIVDIDACALQNTFELNYPEHAEKTVAILNVGSRSTLINVCRNGETLIIGDASFGGKYVTDQLTASLGISFEEVEKLKRGGGEDLQGNEFYEALQKAKMQLCHELHKKLTLLCDSVAVDGLDLIMISGGGANLQGFAEELTNRTEVAVESIDPLKSIHLAENIDQNLIDSCRNSLGVAVGLGLRQVGDRVTSV